MANAVIDHTDAVMLSGESAFGKYPVESVVMMSDIVRKTEQSRYDDVPLHYLKLKHETIEDAISVVADDLAEAPDIGTAFLSWLDHVLFVKQQTAGPDFRTEARASLLRHHHQNIRRADIGVEDRLIGNNQLDATSAAAGLRAEALSQGDVLVVVDRRCTANDHARQDDALAAESGDADLGGLHRRSPGAT